MISSLCCESGQHQRPTITPGNCHPPGADFRIRYGALRPLLSPPIGDVGMTSFSDYIQKQSMASTELPLVHTTEYFRLASIQASNMLQTTDCSIFKEPLLYFFYG